ncbi:MAG: VOC family protein [Proteiniphilum sp.]|uniref:VOC family protein n=1 Tax=Proteiniphilum sp. TaxID=1926877 RepID=UPI002B1FB876|nr:VOC family protein [Proteiniphilum sp.]MEA5127249.1 VOC family protein [Proteiniphilum sp.]
MVKLDPYLNFDGTCEEAFNLYKSVFGGKLSEVMRMGDMEGMEVPEAYKDHVMHVSLQLPNNLLMGSDVVPGMGNPLRPGNNNYIYITADSREEADRLFSELSAGGEVEMPMEDMFWGDYFGSFKDRFGIWWMVGYSFLSDTV